MTAKQTVTLAALEAGLAGKQLVKTEENGKVIVQVTEGVWPAIIVGKHGGVQLPAIKSYPENGKDKTAMTAALIADQLLAKQEARAAKKAQPAVAVEEEKVVVESEESLAQNVGQPVEVKSKRQLKREAESAAAAAVQQ